MQRLKKSWFNYQKNARNPKNGYDFFYIGYEENELNLMNN